MDKIRILCLSLWYPLAIARYWENAFNRNPNVDLITCGQFTGSWIPWLGGMTVLDKYSKPPTYPLPFKPSVGKISYELIRAQLPKKWIPDLVISIDAGVNWINKPQEGVVVTIGTDGHVLDYTHARKISDKFFNMHPVFSFPDDILLNYAFDPDVHYAMSSIKKDTDAVLIGMPYPQRDVWIQRLRDAGVSVLYENGPIFDEYREINNRARIGLNYSSKGDTNARFFELLAMQLCVVTDRTQDIARFGFVEGQHYLGFTGIDEAISKVLWAKHNPKEAKAIALSGYNKVNKGGFTYDDLIMNVLRECNLHV